MESQGLLTEVTVFKKITFAALFLILGSFIYFIFIFDINDYKSELEDIISQKSNTEFRISGDLDLDLGRDTIIKAELLSVRKDNAVVLESDVFTAEVSLSQILQGKFDISSVSLLESKLYGLNIDETIIQAYSLLSGKKYSMNNRSYSNIKSINARGVYSDGMLKIDNIQIQTELLKADGFGKIFHMMNHSVYLRFQPSLMIILPRRGLESSTPNISKKQKYQFSSQAIIIAPI